MLCCSIEFGTEQNRTEQNNKVVVDERDDYTTLANNGDDDGVQWCVCYLFPPVYDSTSTIKFKLKFFGFAEESLLLPLYLPLSLTVLPPTISK